MIYAYLSAMINIILFYRVGVYQFPVEIRRVIYFEKCLFQYNQWLRVTVKRRTQVFPDSRVVTPPQSQVTQCLPSSVGILCSSVLRKGPKLNRTGKWQVLYPLPTWWKSPILVFNTGQVLYPLPTWGKSPILVLNTGQVLYPLPTWGKSPILVLNTGLELRKFLVSPVVESLLDVKWCFALLVRNSASSLLCNNMIGQAIVVYFSSVRWHHIDLLCI